MYETTLSISGFINPQIEEKGKKEKTKQTTILKEGAQTSAHERARRAFQMWSAGGASSTAQSQQLQHLCTELCGSSRPFISPKYHSKQFIIFFFTVWVYKSQKCPS